MANTKTKIQHEYGVNVLIYQWSLTEDDDAPEPMYAPDHPDKTIQVFGDFGSGGSIAAQGSLHIASETPTYAALDDPTEDVIAITAADIKTILENTALTRPIVTAGTSVDVTVRIMAVRAEKGR